MAKQILLLENLIKQLHTYVTDPKVFIDAQKIIENFCAEVDDNNFIVASLLDKITKNNLHGREVDIALYLLSLFVDSEKNNSDILSSAEGDVIKHRLALVLQKKQLFCVSEFNKHNNQKIKLANYAVYHILESINSNGDNIDDVLSQFQHDERFCRELVDILMLNDKNKSSWVLGYFAQSNNSELAMAAIESLKKQENPESIRMLHNLVFYTDYMPCSDEEKSTIEEYYLSWLDSYDNRIAIVTYSVDNMKNIAFFMLNQNRGIQNVLTMKNLSLVQLNSIIEKWRKSIDIKKVSKEICLNTLNHSLWLQREQKIPLPASFILRDVFRYPDIRPEEYKIDLENFGVTADNITPLVNSSGFLVKEFPFSQWWINSEICEKYIADKVQKEKNIKYDVMKDFTETFFSNQNESIAQKFLHMADFMNMLSPDEYKKQIETCVAIYIAITKEKTPLVDIAFIKQLVLVNIRNIQEKIYGG